MGHPTNPNGQKPHVQNRHMGHPTPFHAAYVWAARPLLMQKKPTITSGEVKSLLQRNAAQDSFTGEVPNL